VFLFALVISVSAFAEDFFAWIVLQAVTFQVESPNVGSINPVACVRVGQTARPVRSTPQLAA